MNRTGQIASLLLCILNLCAEEPAEILAPPPAWAQAGLELLTGKDGLRESFWRGSPTRVEALLLPPALEHKSEHTALLKAIQREFKQNRYLSFELENYQPRRKLPPNRFLAEIRLVTRHEARDSALRGEHETVYNGQILFEMLPEGQARIVRCDYFHLLGRQLPADLIGDLLLGGVLLLAGLTFWAWTLLAAKDHRPKSYAWRWAVGLLPVLGGLLFLLFKYLPARLSPQTPNE